MTTSNGARLLKAAAICTVLALLCLWPVMAQCQDRGMKTALIVMGVGQGIDTVTTLQALSRGAVETNPIMGANPSTARLVAAKAPLVVVGWLLTKVHQRHPKLAKGTAYVIGAVGVGLAVHNSRQGRR